MNTTADVVVVGAGAIGSAIARELSKYQLDVVLLEKNEDIGGNASKANGGSVICGYDYQPGSLDGLLGVAANPMFDQLTKDLDVDFKRIGLIQVAMNEEDMKAIQLVSDVTMVLYIVLIAMFLVFGPVRYIVETAVTSIGFVVQHYPTMATWLDPLRLTASEPGGAGFPQSWTVYFNANWLVNMCSVPFFIAKISEGRTMKKTILGGLAGGVGATYCSFIVFGNYSIFRQMSGIADYAKMAANGATESQIITEIIKTLPMAGIVMVLFIITMIGLFATTFDANSLILAGFCQRNRKLGQEPSKGMRYATSECAGPDAALMTSGYIQLHRQYYHLPVRAHSGITSSKKMDYQAGYEHTLSFLLNALSGVNVVSQAMPAV